MSLESKERQSVKVERQSGWRKRRGHTSGAVTSRCSGGGEGKATEGLIKRKMSLFNLETLPAAKRAGLLGGCAACPVIRGEQIHLSSPCVGCKVDYSLERRRAKKKKRNHAAEAPTTGSNHSASAAALCSLFKCSAHDGDAPLQARLCSI